MSAHGLVDQRYELLSILGRGGHGIVYRALDTETGEHVAIKFLHETVAIDPQYNIRMLREAQIMAQLAGTSAIRVHGLRTNAVDGALYLIMELLIGKDFEQYLCDFEDARRRLPVDMLFELLDPIVHTLEAAHDRGIVHRDLKPGNIFVLDAGGVRLLDFGLAKVLSASPLTSDGMVAGSPSYIAPEAWRGNPRILDHRIDVYSLGAIVFRALGGRVPFEGADLVEKLRLVTSAQRPSLHALRPDLPKDVDDWVAQTLAIDPDKRFLRIRGMWNALRGLLGTS